MGTGYIREWDENTLTGTIRLCDGGGGVDDGEESAFSLSGCSDNLLKAKLRKEKSFRLGRRCNPEPLKESIKVKCNVTVVGGGLSATDVAEI